MTITAYLTTPTTGDYAALSIKDRWKEWGATVPMSSTGAGGGYSSSTDVITAAVGAGSMSAAGLTTGLGWVKLRLGTGANSVGYREVCIQRGTSSILWRVTYSPTGFLGGTPGDTRVPSAVTSTDQVTLLGGGTDASPTFAQLFPGDGLFNLTIAYDAATLYYRAHFLLNSGPTSNGGIGILPMLPGSYPAIDFDPLGIFAGYLTTFFNVASIAGNPASYAAPKIFDFYKFGAVGQATTNSIGCNFKTVGTVAGGLARDAQELPAAFVAHSGDGSTGAMYAKGYFTNALGSPSTVAQVPHGTRLLYNSRYYERVGDLWLETSSTVP